MPGPLYHPDLVRRLAGDISSRIITRVAESGCYALGLTLEDVWQALQELDTSRCRFHKSMESDKIAGDWFDVYRVLIGRISIYLKFKVIGMDLDQNKSVAVVDRGAIIMQEKLVVVVSFKEK